MFTNFLTKHNKTEGTIISYWEKKFNKHLEEMGLVEMNNKMMMKSKDSYGELIDSAYIKAPQRKLINPNPTSGGRLKQNKPQVGYIKTTSKHTDKDGTVRCIYTKKVNGKAARFVKMKAGPGKGGAFVYKPVK